MPFTTPPTFAAGAILTAAQQSILGGDLTFLANPPKVRAYNSSAISVPSGTSTNLTFNSERFDTDSMHSTSTNTSRITFTTAGTYLVSAHVEFAANATGARAVDLTANAAGTLIGSILVPAVSGQVTILSVTSLYAFAAGDYVQVGAYQTSGGNLDVNADLARSPEFSAVWVSL